MTALIAVLLVILIFYCYWRYFYFFRDPERKTPSGNNIIAPADGKVVYIRKVKKGIIPLSIKKKKEIRLEEITKMDEIHSEDKYIIGIFMFPWSVHVNRAPISGRIAAKKYSERKNLPMTIMWMRSLFGIKPYYSHSEHIFQNERNTLLIKGKFPVAIVQIADIYVRKILCYVKLNQKVKKGQRVGMIKMGSQVDIIFPALNKIKIKVKDGQYVKAGETILADY